MPIGIVAIDGVWYFNSGPATRKSRNIAGDPRCVVSIATHPFDLVVEGSAARVADADELAAVATEFSVPPSCHVYRITPATVFAFGTAEPYGATKFDLTR
jgi:hypothetical protein